MVQNIPSVFTEGLCAGYPLKSNLHRYYVSCPEDIWSDWKEKLIQEITLEPFSLLDHILSGYRLCAICSSIYSTQFNLFILPFTIDPNSYLELGIALGLGVPLFIVTFNDTIALPQITTVFSIQKQSSIRETCQILSYKLSTNDFSINTKEFIARISKQLSNQYLIFAGDLVDDEDFVYSITEQFQQSISHLNPFIFSNQFDPHLSLKIDIDFLISQIQSSRFQIYRVDEDCSPLVFLALGIAIALNKPFLMLCQKEVPSHLKGLAITQFKNWTALEKMAANDWKKFLQKNAF